MKKSKQDKLDSAFQSIQIGKSNAFIPPKSIEKEFSDYVDKKNLKGDVIIPSSSGYYRPNPFSQEEDEEFNSYISKELDRADAIIEKCNRMRYTYNSIISSIIKTWEGN